MGKIRRLTDDKKTPDKLTRVTKQKKMSEYLQTAANTKVKVEPDYIKTKTPTTIGKLANNKKYKLFQFQIMPKPKSKVKDPSQGGTAAEPTPGSSNEEQPTGGAAQVTQQGGSNQEPTQGGIQIAHMQGDSADGHLLRRGAEASQPGMNARGSNPEGSSSRGPLPETNVGVTNQGDPTRDTALRAGLQVPQPGDLPSTTQEGGSARRSLPPATGGTPPPAEMGGIPRGSGASSVGYYDQTPMEEEDHTMEEGARQRRISKRKRSEPRDSEVGDVMERVTDLLLNGDAGNKKGNQVQPNTKRFKRTESNTILPTGNGAPTSIFQSRNEPGSMTPRAVNF